MYRAVKICFVGLEQRLSRPSCSSEVGFQRGYPFRVITWWLIQEKVIPEEIILEGDDPVKHYPTEYTYIYSWNCMQLRDLSQTAPSMG